MLTFLARQAFSRPHRLASMIAGARQASLLRAHPHPTVRALGVACGAAQERRLGDEDARVVAGIEALRARASTSSERLRIDDYGAGAPDSTFSEEQMAAGRVIERTVGEACRASKKPAWAGLLWHLVREFKPERCVELGCCLGISACYQGHALRSNGGGGRLWTLEGAPMLAAVARRHLAEQGLDGRVEVVVGRFQDTLPGLLARHAPIDYAFIDGHHDEQATLRYFEQLLPHLAPRALLVFDDIDWSDGMRRAWARLVDDRRIQLSIDCGEVGVCAVDATIKDKLRAAIPLA
ncbi:MAG: O-methyltransferase [Planctomycetia bacterium]|jgi:predicted O-methyltransferase YrrM